MSSCLKRFQEEEDLHVYLLLDCSRSMAFGDPAEVRLCPAGRRGARRTSRWRTWTAWRWSPSPAISWPIFRSTRGKARILSLLKFLEGLQTQGTVTDLARVVKNFVHRGQRRGLAVVLSDLFDPRGFQGGLDLLRHHRYEPHVVQIVDRREADPGFKGDVELQDVETGTIRKVTVTERNLRQYRKIFADFLESVRTYCNAYGIGGTLASHRDPVRRAAACG